MKTSITSLIALAGLALVVGCAQEPATEPSSNTTPSAPAIDGSRFLLKTEPADAATVIEAREQAQDGADVILVGRIGGSENPWVDGRAAFSIVDQTLKACSDIPGDECKKPWDYCCETHKLPASTALVKFVDADGQPLKADARKLLSLRELQTVVVRGKAKRDEAGNLTVLASGLFVRDISQPEN
ncbi:MAG: hypothetical protein O3B13_14745 [Planctomycetota bacterium]|nr:hypothetical protein [Planctomycetota bacterium]MDA1164351.1 hypothetical protein [Planctomycetota bacterium]